LQIIALSVSGPSY